jgi:hypothetical protein
MCPVSQADRHDTPGSVDQLVPRVAAMIDDVLTTVEDAIGEPVVGRTARRSRSHSVRALGGQWHERDIRWHEEFRGEMPSSLVEQDNGMCAWRHGDYAIPYPTVHVGRFNAGIALNIVPNRRVLDFEIRNIATENPTAILAVARRSRGNRRKGRRNCLGGRD